MKNKSFALILILILSSCSWAPGMQMDESLSTPNIVIMPITADLIYDQELIGRREASNVSAQLLAKRNKVKRDFQYLIGPRDVLSITVWDHPELTIPAGEFRGADIAGHLVAEDGTIFYPYAGLVKVSGLSVAEIRQVLTNRIARTIAKPQLDVRVASFRSQKAYVVGEVAEPGLVPITDVPLTVVDAVNLVGGVTPESDLLNVTVSRNGKVTYINLLATYEKGDISHDMILQDGDIIQVPDRNLQKVFVLGEVTRPSSYLMHKGRMSLAEAIGDAGGVDQRSSNPARVFVLRGTKQSAEIYHLNSESPEALILGDKFKLMPRDIVYVDTAEVVRWSRVIENLVGTTELLRNLSEIGVQSFDLTLTK